jgi:hypothetical protein
MKLIILFFNIIHIDLFSILSKFQADAQLEKNEIHRLIIMKKSFMI